MTGREDAMDHVREQIERRGVLDGRVLSAMRRVPRREFVPEECRSQAWEDGALSIGCGQTISQPYIVARMTECLGLKMGDRVLEVGTGSGYQAAILAEILGEVFTVEIIETLACAARERLKRLGYGRVQVRWDDGYQGWKEHAPYDAILVAAAADRVPQPLIDQLKPGGRMVIPIRRGGLEQTLVLFEKDLQGRMTQRPLTRVVFVPLTREVRP